LKIDHPHYFLEQILADPVLNIPERKSAIRNLVEASSYTKVN